MTPCSLIVGFRSFGGTCCLHLQGRKHEVSHIYIAVSVQCFLSQIEKRVADFFFVLYSSVRFMQVWMYSKIISVIVGSISVRSLPVYLLCYLRISYVLVCRCSVIYMRVICNM
jgi:hypothetical protein